MPDQQGLRERKKRATHQAISNVATGLFLERGFDEVTVAEIAEAANVAKMTVFNYFPRKEDLFFDREEEGRVLLRVLSRSDLAASRRSRHCGILSISSWNRITLSRNLPPTRRASGKQ